MLYDIINGQTNLCIRVKVRQDNTGTRPGQGFTGLTNAASGLVVSTICDNESAPTAYTSAASTIDTISSLGTYVAPTTGHCRLARVSDSSHPGLIEVQLANARLAVAGAKEITITISGVAGMADCDVKIPLRAVNPYSSTSFMTSVPSVAGGVILAPTGLDGITIEAGLNARQALAIMAAESAGVLAGATTTTITFAGAGVATNRITATVDASGNRTAIALNPPT